MLKSNSASPVGQSVKCLELDVSDSALLLTVSLRKILFFAISKIACSMKQTLPQFFFFNRLTIFTRAFYFQFSSMYSFQTAKFFHVKLKFVRCLLCIEVVMNITTVEEICLRNRVIGLETTRKISYRLFHLSFPNVLPAILKELN